MPPWSQALCIDTPVWPCCCQLASTCALGAVLQVFRKIVNDPRFSALSTLGEKKQCYHEYVQQRRNEEKEEERRKARQAREDFVKMLEGSGNVDSRTKCVAVRVWLPG